MIKRLFCILLSLMLLTVAAVSLAEDAAAAETEVPAETEAPAESAEPVLLVTINGEEIYSDNSYLNSVVAYYMDYAASYGYDTTAQDLIDTINQYSMDYTLRDTLIIQKAAEFGLDKVTDEEKAEMEQAAKAAWSEIVDSFIADEGNITESSTDEEKAAARADAEATILNGYGYTEEIYVDSYVNNTIESLKTERLADYLNDGRTVSEEDVLNYFNDLVQEDKETYSDVGTYEFYTQYYGQSSYYTPEGYRAVTHILLPVDEELMNTWKDLSARLEEQQSEAESESTETEQPAEAEETPAADPEVTPEPTAEPVTQEMVDAAEKAILDSVQATVDEIKAKRESGVSFEDLIKEYGTDPGMKDDDTRAKGYYVHSDSILWDTAFRDAAMALEKIGDISEPVLSQHGVHILQYLKDIPGGAVELTEDMKNEFHDTLLDEMRNEALNTALDEWMETSEIVYTEAGEAWKLPPEEEEATEEAAAAD